MSSNEKLAQGESVFKPRYPKRILLTVYLYPLGFIVFILFIYMAFASHRIFPYGLFALVFAFTLISMPMILFREARFQDDGILVKRYFLPAHRIPYEDVLNLTSRGLVAKRGGIPLTNVGNRKEFEKIIRQLASRHLIKLQK